MNRTETEFKIHQLVITASNWDGPIWNSCKYSISRHWTQSNGGDIKQGWDCLKASAFIKRQLIDPCAKDESKNEPELWTVRWPVSIRHEAALEIVGQMTDEFELGNVPTHRPT